jgi:prepilin signal peptidase PulO-like enzyme (type II secretory pathway)
MWNAVKVISADSRLYNCKKKENFMVEVLHVILTILCCSLPNSESNGFVRVHCFFCCLNLDILPRIFVISSYYKLDRRYLCFLIEIVAAIIIWSNQ